MRPWSSHIQEDRGYYIPLERRPQQNTPLSLHSRFYLLAQTDCRLQGMYLESRWANLLMQLTPLKPKILSDSTPMRGAPNAPIAPAMHLSKAYTDVLIRSGTTCKQRYSIERHSLGSASCTAKQST